MKKEINLLKTITNLDNQSIVKIDDNYYLAQLQTLSYTTVDKNLKNSIKEKSNCQVFENLLLTYKNSKVVIPEQYSKNKDIFFLYLNQIKEPIQLDMNKMTIVEKLLLQCPYFTRSYLKYDLNNKHYMVYVSDQCQIEKITIINDQNDDQIVLNKSENSMHNLHFHLFQFILKYYGKNRCF